MSLISRVLSLLEHDVVYAPGPPTTAEVDYYVETPSGTRGRFTRRIALNQLPAGARSETSVLFYLRKMHPHTDVTIVGLDYK